MARIVSVNVSLPRQVVYGNGSKMRTSIMKKPVKGQVFLDFSGFAGDVSADLVHHGGVDKAVCIYSQDHFPYWNKELGRSLEPAAFGENLTLEGMTESEVHIGDIFRIGEVEIQCTQPRQPCHKLIKIFNIPQMARKVQNTGYTGYYARVIKQGRIEAGAGIELVKTDPHAFTVDDANRLLYKDKKNLDKIRELLDIQPLSDSWREMFQNRLHQYS